MIPIGVPTRFRQWGRPPRQTTKKAVCLLISDFGSSAPWQDLDKDTDDEMLDAVFRDIGEGRMYDAPARRASPFATEMCEISERPSPSGVGLNDASDKHTLGAAGSRPMLIP